MRYVRRIEIPVGNVIVGKVLDKVVGDLPGRFEHFRILCLTICHDETVQRLSLSSRPYRFAAEAAEGIVGDNAAGLGVIIDKLNSADAMVFQTEKQLKEYGDKLPADKKAEIESAVEELKIAHKAEDIPAIDAAMEKMNNLWQAASQEMYQNTQAGGQAPPPGGQPGSDGGDGGPKGGDDEVTDVDFEEVDDNK